MTKYSGYYQFKKRFYGLADKPTIFQGKIDRTLEYCKTAWVNDIIVATRGHREEHENKLFEVLNKLEKAGYRASKRKMEVFMKQTKWLGHKIIENGLKPNEEKMKAILKLKPPNKTKELKSFLGPVQCLAEVLPKPSKKKRKTQKTILKK